MKNQSGGILIEALYGIVLSISVFLLLFSLILSGWKERKAEEKRFFKYRNQLRERISPPQPRHLDPHSRFHFWN